MMKCLLGNCRNKVPKFTPPLLPRIISRSLASDVLSFLCVSYLKVVAVGFLKMPVHSVQSVLVQSRWQKHDSGCKKLLWCIQGMKPLCLFTKLLFGHKGFLSIVGFEDQAISSLDPPEAGRAAGPMVCMALLPRHFASCGTGAGATSCVTDIL